MKETLLDRFLQIKNYKDIDEVDAYLKNEIKILNGEFPNHFMDVLALSMLADHYYTNVPEDIQVEIINRHNGVPELINMMESQIEAEKEMIAMSDWAEICLEEPNSEIIRKYIWALIDEHHENGWNIEASIVTMENGQLDEHGHLNTDEDEDAVDLFKMDYLIRLVSIYNDFAEERSLQLFFKKENEPKRKAFILVNCLWDEQNPYNECTIGPLIVSGANTGNIEFITPTNIGLPVLSQNN